MTDTTPEFSHRVPVVRVSAAGTSLHLEAGPDSRAKLAARFGLIVLDRLEADLILIRDGRGVGLGGTLEADVTQACVVSGEPVPARIMEQLTLRFERLADPVPDCEVELSDDALDLLPIEDGAIDVGEALAQSLAVALDPYPRASPEVLAEVRRRLVSEEAIAEEARRSSPFASLRSQ